MTARRPASSTAAAALSFALVVVASAPAPAFADVEGDLRARLRGRFAVLRSPVASECTEHYSDNDVSGRRAGGSGPVSLPAGELATIDNVQIGWTRFDVNLSLQSPYRVSIVDGPYTLYEHRTCRIQLRFDVPREVRKDAARAEAAVLEVLEVHDGESDARRSELWNRREPEALPEDHEQVWAEYRVWKAAQVNVAVREKIEQVLAEGQSVLQYMDDDPEYLESFALGVASRRYWNPGDCDSALSASFYPSGSGGKSSQGFAAGQHLAWTVAVARALGGCFVDVVPAH